MEAGLNGKNGALARLHAMEEFDIGYGVVADRNRKTLDDIAWEKLYKLIYVTLNPAKV
jgi:hypothetical protein